MSAIDYPITFPYGATSDPYSPTHPHRGDDRPCPSGTPVIISSVTIALTGATGLVTGPHLHIQEWLSNVANTRKPQNAFAPGTVIANGTASEWGNYITISVGGWNTTYCHLSQINVSNGQVIGGSNGGNNGGTGMNDDTSRQIAYHFLGRHGFDGRPNGLAGPQELQGRPLTNAEMSSIFLSDESRAWRDQQLPALFAERDNLRYETSSQKSTIASLERHLTEQAIEINKLEEEKAQLEHNLDTLHDDNAKLADENKELIKQVNDLEAQLAASDGNTTYNFTFIGLILWPIIKKFGIKKITKR